MEKILLLKRLIGIYFKTAVQKYLAYPFDFYARLMQVAISLIGSIGGIFILYTQTNSINGWKIYDSIMVAGTYMLVQGAKNLFIEPSLSSISGLGGDLWTGNFDYILMKPISSRLYISIKNWDPMAFIDIVVSVIIILLATSFSGYSITFKDVFMFVFVLSIGLFLIYSIMMIFVSVAFWYLGTPLIWIFNSIMEMGRYPVTFYPKTRRLILTWILPIGFIITVPSQALVGTIGWATILFGIMITVIFYLFSSWFYNFSIKKYSGASS